MNKYIKLFMENNKLGETYEGNDFITKYYFRSKVFVAIKLVGLNKEDVILDFGCGEDG